MNAIQTTNNQELQNRVHADKLQAIRELVTDGLSSDHSRRAYGKAIDEFIRWYQAAGEPGLSKAIVQRYKKYLQDLKLSAATINQRLSAIRKLGQEAADNGLIAEQMANGIKNASGVSSSGVRLGNWLEENQAQTLLNAPNVNTLKGKRDRAILALFLGTGVRCSELNSLTVDHIQQRDGRWVIVDLIGKGTKKRTVAIPSWCKVAINAWTAAAGITEGRLFRAINKGDKLADSREIRTGIYSDGLMSNQGIANVVTEYSKKTGFNISAHDLRRTFAKLAYRSGAKLEQIQLTLGHESLETTQKYLGGMLDLDDAPCDYLKLKI